MSVQVWLMCVGMSRITGVLLGLVAGYVGGWLDAILTLCMDVLLAFPAVLLAIAIAAMLGSSLPNVMLAIGIVTTPTSIRVVPGSTLSLRKAQFVEAALSLGAPTTRGLPRHLFPNL